MAEQSSTISVTAGVATQWALTRQPSASAQSGVAFAQQPVLQLRDGSGNAVSQAGVVVTAAIATGGGALGGTVTATARGSGVAGMTGHPGGRPAVEHTQRLSATGLTGATSTAHT